MVTLVLLTFLVTVGVSRLTSRQWPLAWIGPLAGLLLLCLFGLEAQLRGRDLFISDENIYLAEGRTADLASLKDRYLWILLNALVLRYDWSLGGLPLKLVGLPLLALLVALLWRLFGRDRLVWAVPVMLPYMAYTAAFNLRDTAILTATAGSVYLLDGGARRWRGAFVLALGALYLLRPVIALLSAAIWLGILAASGLAGVARGRVPVRALLVVGGSLVVAGALFSRPVLDRVQRYVVWYEYLAGEGFTERALERGLDPAFASGPWENRIAVGAARYVVAPMPTSLLSRILRGGTPQWGLVDDVVRLIHQLAYYAMVAFLVLRWRSWIPALRALSRGQVMMLAALVLYLPLYSAYHFGAGHQRIKIPFQLAVMLFAIAVHRARERHAQPQRPDGVANERARVRRPGPQGVLVPRASGL